MAFKAFGPVFWAIVAMILAFVALYPDLVFSDTESLAMVTFDTALLREQLVEELQRNKSDTMDPSRGMPIPDWYSVHMRTLCRGAWTVSNEGCPKVKDPLSISCETPGALTSWVFRLGWVLFSDAYKARSRSGVPYISGSRIALFPYNDYCTHDMGVPASLLLASAIMAMANALVFLDLVTSRPRLPRFVHYLAIACQSVAAVFVTVVAVDVGNFAQGAAAYSKHKESDLIFDLDVHTSKYYQILVVLAAFAAWISALWALWAVWKHRSEGRLALPIKDSDRAPLIAFHDAENDES